MVRLRKPVWVLSLVLLVFPCAAFSGSPTAKADIFVDRAEAFGVDFVHLAGVSGEFRWPKYLGFIYRIVGKPELEMGAYERALEHRPEDIPARLHLAELHLVLGEYEEAYRQFRRVLELSPAEAAAHGGLGRAASALGRPDEAVELYSEALDLDPGNVNVLRARARRRMTPRCGTENVRWIWPSGPFAQGQRRAALRLWPWHPRRQACSLTPSGSRSG